MHRWSSPNDKVLRSTIALLAGVFGWTAVSLTSCSIGLLRPCKQQPRMHQQRRKHLPCPSISHTEMVDMGMVIETATNAKNPGYTTFLIER